jgi:hypothetical protein
MYLPTKKIYTLSNTFLVGKLHVLPVACFVGRVFLKTKSCKSGCVITSVPNVSYKRKKIATSMRLIVIV